MQCAAMAAAIKKEILEDEERQQRRSAEIDHHSHRDNAERESSSDHGTTNGHGDIEMDCVVNRLVNGHENGLKSCEVNRDHEMDRDEDEEDLRRQELRTHLFLATVSSHHQSQQQKQHQQSQQDAQDLSTANDSSGFHVPCPLCQVPLEQRIFRQHLDRHYPRDSPVCPVIQCGRRFAHPNSVRNHMRLKHAVQWLKMKAMRSSGGPFVGLITNGTEHAIPISAASASNPFTKKEFL